MKSKQIKELIVAIALPLFVGFLASIITGDGMDIYSTLNRPSIAPPGIVFPIVWTILFILMGIASYLVYLSDSKYRETALRVYVLQLFVNFSYNLFFFHYGWYFFSFLWTILLLFINLIMFQLFYRCNKVAGYLLIPYLLWNSFAILLGYLIVYLN